MTTSCLWQTPSWGRQRCGHPGRRSRTCTRRCWWQTWSMLLTKRWSKTCKFTKSPLCLISCGWDVGFHVCGFYAGGIMPLRTRLPPCKVRPRTAPTPTAARSRLTYLCSWRRPAASTLRWVSASAARKLLCVIVKLSIFFYTCLSCTLHSA